MFYSLAPELKEIPLCPPAPETLTAGYITAEELAQSAAHFGFHESVVAECLGDKNNYRNTIDVYEDYTFGVVSIVDANDVYMTSDRVAFFFKKNLFLLVTLHDVDGSTHAAFEQAVRRFKPENATLEKLIFALLEGTVARDAQALAKFGFEISALEEKVSRGRADKAVNAQIYTWKKRLLILQNYYEQLIDIGDGLRENENGIFASDTLHYFALFAAKAERLSSTVQRMNDAVSELRSAHQAAMDYSLNSLMKVFSVITTIFLPLTLLVGWYGMNFTHMPELTWEFGYLFVIGLAVLIVVVNLVFFKKKNLL